MRQVEITNVTLIVIIFLCHNLFAVEKQDNAQRFSRLLGSCIVSKTGNTLKLNKPLFTNITGSSVFLDGAMQRQEYYQKKLDGVLNETVFPLEAFDPRFSFYLVLFGNKPKGEMLKGLVLMRYAEAEKIAMSIIVKNPNNPEANIVLALLSIRKKDFYSYLEKMLNENPTKAVLLVDWGIRFLSITEPNRYAWDFLSQYLYSLVMNQQKIDFDRLPDETLHSIYTGLLFKYPDNLISNHYQKSQDFSKISAFKNFLASRLRTSASIFPNPSKSLSRPYQNVHMVSKSLSRPIPINFNRIHNPYKLMHPTYFHKIEKAATELISEKNDFHWGNVPIRDWACICIGMDKFVPNAKIIDHGSLLYSFALLCAEEYEESAKFAQQHIKQDSAFYSANLILGLLTVYDSQNVQYLIKSFQLNPQKTLSVLCWFSANTFAISEPERYRSFLRLWLSCAADYRDRFQNISPFEARYLCSRIRNFSLQNEEKIKLLYIQLNKVQSDNVGY